MFTKEVGAKELSDHIFASLFCLQSFFLSVLFLLHPFYIVVLFSFLMGVCFQHLFTAATLSFSAVIKVSARPGLH